MSLDLSALRGQRSDDADAPAASAPAPWSLSTPVVPAPLDASALPAHDGRGETPTSDFGAVFGATPTAPVHVTPAQDPAPAASEAPPVSSAPSASFTELISMPPAASPEATEPSSFNWSDLPPVEPTQPDAPTQTVEQAGAADSAPIAAPSAPVTPPPVAPSGPTSLETPTVAAPIVWSLDDLEPEPERSFSATSAPGASVPPAAESGRIKAEAGDPGDVDDPDDGVDAVAALFGEEARPEIEEPRAGDLPPGGPDGAWADEPVDPELPETQAMSSVDVPRAPSTPRESAPLDAPTVTYVPPVAPTDSTSDAPTRVVPVSPTERPIPIGGASSRGITPIDVSKVPAAWASAAPAAPIASATAPAELPLRSRGGGGADERRRRILLFAGIAVAFVVVLAALFFFGRALAGGSGTSAAPITTTSPPTAPSSSATATTTPKASSTPAPVATTASGTAAPGVHPYTELGGGECLSAFTDAWQSSYTVVDCGTPHVAQLVYVGTLDGAAGSTYPGAAALEAQVSPQCQSDKAINLSAAQAYTDVQVSDSFPSTAAEWAAGSRSFYCFVNRTGGAQLSSSLAP